MSNARQQGAKSRLKDNSQMWRKRKKNRKKEKKIKCTNTMI